jgi:hypothetical protein
MPISSDRTCLLVKDYVSSLSMPDRHTALLSGSAALFKSTRKAHATAKRIKRERKRKIFRSLHSPATFLSLKRICLGGFPLPPALSFLLFKSAPVCALREL